MSDPVHHDDKGWWFWDETWADRHGPYRTKQECVQHFFDYANSLECHCGARAGEKACNCEGVT